VANDSSTTFYATATDAAGNVSPCSSGLTYVEDSTPPAPPVLTDSDPDSPANDTAPRIKGTAEAGSTVRLFTNATCMGSSVASGTAAVFASPGLAVNVADDSSTTFYATATDAAANVSACSRGLTYVEDSSPPDTIIDSGPSEGSTTTASTATFTFHSTETGSTFGCKLDTGPVEACDAGMKTYTGLTRGSHTFSVVATDAAGNADPSAATRTWTVNTPPVASDDAYAVIGGATLTVVAPGVLGNDSDADGDALTAQLVDAATKGTLTLDTNGALTYTPGEDATGTDTFTYRAFDGLATSNLATVTITITAGCDGVRATRVGTTGNDTLTGTGGNDVIVGLGGNDTIDAGSGNDRVCGGSGNDTIELGSGNDRGFGGTGTDSLRGGSGDDILRGNDGDDLLDGGGDRDALFGDAGVDRLLGGGDNDALDGGSGTPDRCDGEGGIDTATACEQLTSVP
jgi:VCBS repeat-containing protein